MGEFCILHYGNCYSIYFYHHSDRISSSQWTKVCMDGSSSCLKSCHPYHALLLSHIYDNVGTNFTVPYTFFISSRRIHTWEYKTLKNIMVSFFYNVKINELFEKVTNFLQLDWLSFYRKRHAPWVVIELAATLKPLSLFIFMV